ncbi:MAG TPA: type II toxin-antitoxin system RelE/ParE family toxin [Caulifigura sp.]|jgi:hypothetical protein|nr:type II toxin-antitoxin system RelE/ParE family toxin [Caulifigura sp.]
MRAVFIETRSFTAWVQDALTFSEFAAFQESLMEQPDYGAVIPGCGGLRKARVANDRQGQGRRGGSRVIYLHLPEIKQFLLVTGYDKNRKTDLSSVEKQQLRVLVEVAKEEARNKSRRVKRD